MLWAWAIIDRHAGNPETCYVGGCTNRARVIRYDAYTRGGDSDTSFFCLTHAKQSKKFNRRVRALAELHKDHRRRGDQC